MYYSQHFCASEHNDSLVLVHSYNKSYEGFWTDAPVVNFVLTLHIDVFRDKSIRDGNHAVDTDTNQFMQYSFKLHVYCTQRAARPPEYFRENHAAAI